MNLRDYQSECVQSSWEALQLPEARPLITIPTGAGKTICFSHLAERWIASGGGRVLILAHRYELIQQAADKYEAMTGHRPEIEMADSYASSGSSEFWFGGARIVVGSVQTMKGARLRRWPANYFTLIIVDEAHHATAPSYRKIFDHFAEAKVLGVTATPDRADKKNLGKVFNAIAYQMELYDAIYQRGWLVPIKQRFVHVSGIDLSDVDSNWKGDDLDTTQLDAIMRRDESLHAIARPTYERAGIRPTLVFCTGVAHAKAISDILNSYRPGCSEYIASYRIAEDGSQEVFPEEVRSREIGLFQSGVRQFLCSCGVFLEGFDAPPTACISMARPTKSRALYAQAIGRGTRPLAGIVDGLGTPQERITAIQDSGKPDVLVLDFVGNSGKHKLVYADEILFPHASDKARAKARQAIQEEDRERDVKEAVEEAEHSIVEEELRKISDLDKKRRKLASRIRAQFYEKEVNPFGDDVYVPEVKVQVVHVPASDKQCGYVKFLGRQLGKSFDFDSLKRMPRNQVAGIIKSLQAKLGKVKR